MLKLLRHLSIAALIGAAVCTAQVSPVSAAAVSLDADVVRVLQASSSSVTFQVVTAYNPEWRLAPHSKNGPLTYTAPLPKADRSKPILAKNSVIKLSGKVASGGVALSSITRLAGKCVESPSPYNVVLCKVASEYHTRWTGSRFTLPPVTRAMGRCSYYLGLISPQGSGPGVPLESTIAGATFGRGDGTTNTLTISRSCKTTSQLGVLGTFKL
jgi:hypothetical protein